MDLVPYEQPLEGELLDDNCERIDCGRPGRWVMDPFQVDVYDNRQMVCLCDKHYQDCIDDI